MAETQDDSQPVDDNGPEIELAPEKSEATPENHHMTVAEMRQWLRNWIATATGQPADAINDAAPMVELGCRHVTLSRWRATSRISPV